MTNTLSDKGHSGYLTIDLQAIRRNYRALRARLDPAVAGATVKADAYGLGADHVAPVLYEEGCRDFFVAQFHEALCLRRHIGDEARLYVLNGLMPGSEAECAATGIIPVLNSLEQVMRWNMQAQTQKQCLPAVLQIDSGMSRLGLSADEVQSLVSDRGLLSGIVLHYIMSHLASADDPANPQNASQAEVFGRLSDTWPDVKRSFANSGGIFLGKACQGSLARPGIALYGGAPFSGPNPMEPVIRLDVAVIQTRNVPAGTRIGYGGDFVAERAMRLATIAAGYADGLPRSWAQRGSAWFMGTRLPVTGRVSMDSTILDISALPPDALGLGSLVEVIGPSQPLDALADDAGTISYEILTSLGPRYRRQYRQ